MAAAHRRHDPRITKPDPDAIPVKRETVPTLKSTFAVVHENMFLGASVCESLTEGAQGMAAWLHTSGGLPVNVKVLLEGQEEVTVF